MPRCEAASWRDESLEILNRWTSIRWGEGNLAWVVYYPESLIEPWIRAEAERKRLRPDQIESYRTAFVDELRIDSTTPIMLSVQVLGTTPLSLSPLGEHIWLVDSSGRRIKPMVIEKALDRPIQGLVQGLVFFPKQSVESFSVVIYGLVPERETIFTFTGAQLAATQIATVAGGESASIYEPIEDELVVRIPTGPQNTEADAGSAPSDDDIGQEGEIFAPTAPPMPTEPAPETELPPALDELLLPEDDLAEQPIPQMMLSPKQALDIYLKNWISGNTDAMYSMLSARSQEKISKDLFDREALGGGFRGLLKSGYKVNWSDELTAKVTVARKILLMRSLESRTFRFVIEDGTARLVW